MKAAVFERQGLEYLTIKEDVEQPTITDHGVLIKVKATGVTGVIERVGNHVATIKEGDKVVVYNSIFDGTCDMCLNGCEMLCRSGGIIGVITNGGFAEYISASERNVFKIPDDLQWDIAASLATTTKTPYHALR